MTGGFQSAAAAPDDGFAPTVIPVDAPLVFSAFTTKDNLRKAVITGVAASFAVLGVTNHAPADKFLLYQQEDVLRDDRFVVAFNVVLWDGTGVLNALLRQEVCGIGLLKERVAYVFLVPEDLVDCVGVPFLLARAGEDPVRFKPCRDLVHAETLKVFPIDAFDDLCLLRIDYQMSISVLGVSEEAIVVDLNLPLLVAVLKAELHVLRKVLAFLLGQRGHDRQQHLTLGIHRIDGLLLKENGDVHILELSDILQAVQRVTGKSANRLGDDHVDIFGVAWHFLPVGYYNREDEAEMRDY